MSKIAGSCLCDSVSYSSSAEPEMTAVCHCENCQKQTGTASSIIVGIPEDSLSLRGEENIKVFNDKGESGKAVRRHFCGACGSPIMSLVEVVPGTSFIKAGTLEDRSWLEPSVHIWCDTMQPWIDIPDVMLAAPRNPEH